MSSLSIADKQKNIHLKRSELRPIHKTQYTRFLSGESDVHSVNQSKHTAGNRRVDRVGIQFSVDNHRIEQQCCEHHRAHIVILGQYQQCRARIAS